MPISIAAVRRLAGLKNEAQGTTIQAAGVSPLTLAAWNVRSLLDNPISNRQERRRVLVARELACYIVDIAALSQTRCSEQSQLEKVGAGITFFGSGRPKAELREAGVAFAIRNDIVRCLPCLPQSIDDRLMSVPPPDAAKGNLGTPPVEILAPLGQCYRPKAR
ncbi:unnamed protein product [Schistocephalus solidus]|uniref:MOSC domain-containing protein n=1 Tax=Schistocephalus solidus TaxID=70667 RepID=A0A183TC27_SCHSO|nr:unnamed protein product [Schistocephalus solidus]